MKPEVVKEFITSTKTYLEHATYEQKVRYLRLLERAQQQLHQPDVLTETTDGSEHPDFLEEK